MNSTFDQDFARTDLGGESVSDRDSSNTTWGVKEVVVGSIAIILLVVGVYIATGPAQIAFDYDLDRWLTFRIYDTQLPYEDATDDTEVQPVAGFTFSAANPLVALSTIVLTAMATVAAVLAWVALRAANMPRGYIIPIAIATYGIVATAPFAANSALTEAAATVVLPSLAVYGLCAYVIVVVAHHHGGGITQAFHGLKLSLPRKFRDYAIAIGIYAAAYVAVTIWSLGIDFLDAPDWIKIPDNASDILETAGLPLTIVTVAVLAPIGEEIVFRGFAIPGLASRLGTTAAILITSAVFALIHLGPGIGVGILPVTFVLGLAFAFVYHKTQSLTLAIAAHALHNAITIIALATTDTVV